MKRTALNQKKTYFEPEDIKLRLIICPYCQKKFQRITPSHLKKHQVSMDEYKKDHPAATFIGQCRNKLLELYQPDLFKFQQQNKGGYATYQTGKEYQNRDGDTYKVKWTLMLLLNGHLDCRRTLGIFPKDNSTSTFLVFDVDMKAFSREMAVAIVEVLTEYFDSEQIHVVDSGHKGFHITLYFSEPIENKILQEFGLFVKSQVGLPANSPAVEIIPGLTRHLIKLPLSFHHVTNRFCAFLDIETFEPIPSQYDYLLNITPIDTKHMETLIYDASESAKYSLYLYQQNQPRVTIHSNLQAKCQEVFERHTNELGTRHQWTLTLALWMRDFLKYDENQAYAALKDWSIEQYGMGNTTSTMRDIEQDVVDILTDVYVRGKYKIGFARESLPFYQNEIEFIRDLETEEERKVATALLLVSKTYVADITKPFWASERQVMTRCQMTLYSLKKTWRKLIRQGHLQVIEYGKPSANQRKATTYRFTSLANKDESECFVVSNDVQSEEVLNLIG